MIFCGHEEPHEFDSPETTGSWFPGAIMAVICIAIIVTAFKAVQEYALIASIAFAKVVALPL